MMVTLKQTRYLSSVEPENIKEALIDEFQIHVMQEKLGEFSINKVWNLVPRLEGVNVIGTKWVFKNK